METVFRDKKNAGDRPGLGGQEGCGALLGGWSAAVGVMRGFLSEHGHTTRRMHLMPLTYTLANG